MDLNSGHVTVVLSVFNGAPFVARAVASIVHQDYEHFDLYVVDDASTDGTFEIVAPVAESEARVHVIRLRRNIGTYAAKNLVLRHYCHGEFFAHQDADDFSRSDRLTKQVAFLRSNVDIAACGTAIDEFFETADDAPQVPSTSSITFLNEDQCFHRENRYPPLLGPGDLFLASFHDLAQIKIAMNGSLMFRSKCLLDLGGFDGTTRIAGDTELLWRLLRQHPLGNLDETLYSRRFHSQSLTRSEHLGFSSRARRDYIAGIQEQLTRLATEHPEDIMSRDLYYPDVEIEEHL